MLPDETWFYPGHGNDSTLGAERPATPGVARTGLVRRLADAVRVYVSVPSFRSQVQKRIKFANEESSEGSSTRHATTCATPPLLTQMPMAWSGLQPSSPLRVPLSE